MKGVFSSLFRVVSGLMLCLGLLFSQSNLASAQETIDRIVERGVLRVGFSSFVPWAMQDKEGKYIGFEIDVATRLAKDLGVELQLIPTNWDGIIPALMAGKFDVIIGGMGANVQRGLSVNFTVPYDYALMDAIVSKKSPKKLMKLEDLNDKSVIVAVRTGSSAAFLANTQLPNATKRFFNEEAPAVEEVLSGRAHVFISARPLPTIIADKNPDLVSKNFEITTYREPIGFAVRKNEFNTLNVFDTWIRQMHGIGWLEERSNYWFSTTKWQDLIQQ